MIQRVLFELSYLLGKTPWDTGVSPPELLEFLNTSPPGRALDLGCGTGTNAISMAKYGWEVIGIDLSKLAICMARRKARIIDVQASFIQGDVLQLKGIKCPFDLTLDIGCFHTLTSLSHHLYVDNIGKILRPGGTFLLYTWLHSPGGGNQHVLSEYRIQHLFEQCCECVNITQGYDQAGNRSSAWFKMRRLP